MRYTTSEISNNGAAYDEAVARLGGSDDIVSPLDINKPYTPVAWENYPAVANSDFASEWYGASVDDLIAAGMKQVFLIDPDPDVIKGELDMIKAGTAYFVTP